MECALWYWSHGSTGFWLCEDEDRAVRIAAGDSDDSYAIAGVEFEDGTYLARDEWPALKAYEDEQWRRIYADLDAKRRGEKPQPPPVQEVTPPFDGPPARTTEPAPPWMRRRR